MINELLSMFTRHPSPRERRATELHQAARERLAKISNSIRNGQRPHFDSTPTTEQLIEDIEGARKNGLAAFGGDE